MRLILKMFQLKSIFCSMQQSVMLGYEFVLSASIDYRNVFIFLITIDWSTWGTGSERRKGVYAALAFVM